MNASIARVVPSALSLCLLAGTALGQQTYTGGSAVNGEWSRPANWLALPMPTPKQPPQNGGANQTITIDVPVGNQTTSAVDQTAVGMPFFELRTLTYAATSVSTSLTGGPNNVLLRFSNNPSIVLLTANANHDIQNTLELNNTLTINGAGANSRVLLMGRITPGPAAPGAVGINISVNAASAVFLSGTGTLANNTDSNFTGGINLNSGILVIGRGAAAAPGNANTNALGTGPLNINGPNTTTRAGQGETVQIANNVYCAANTNFGAAGINGSLRITGLFNMATSANNQGGLPVQREITLLGGNRQTLDLGGEIQLLEKTKLLVTGDTEPTLVKGVLKTPKKDNWGSRMVWSGAATLLNGEVTFVKSTLDFQGTVGAANNKSKATITMGNGTDNSALIGRSTMPGPRGAGPVPTFFFAAADPFINNIPGLVLKKNTRLQPGASPGIMAVNGGVVEMEPGSSYGVTLNSYHPGDGDGFYGQLLLQEGAAMHLQCSAFNERPILNLEIQHNHSVTDVENFSFNDMINDPYASQGFTIIDQDAGAPSLYTPAVFGGGNMFMSWDGTALVQGAMFNNEGLPSNYFFQIDYFGGDDHNDVVLHVVPLPTPGAASALALGGLTALRRKRR
jgi:hypothetical protein